MAPASTTLSHVLVVASILLSSSSTILSSDRQALLCLKLHLSDPTGALAAWNNNASLDFCRWHGVSCRKQQAERRVSALDLEGVGLVGQIPPCISNLTSLARIHLPNNRLNGVIPPELGLLAGLNYLNLSSNSLGGKIPSNLSSCSGLEVIALGSNSIEGEILANLGALPSLVSLDLTSNNLLGRIPVSLGISAAALETVLLSNNLLVGEIPPFLANSSSLRTIYLANNSLSGGVPASLFNGPSIQTIILKKNNFSGPIPPFTNSSSSLSHIDLTWNSFSGEIPSSIGNLSSLSALMLFSNQLQGTIPESLVRASGMRFLDLSYNNLTGTVPNFVYNFTFLEFLGLGMNAFEGSLPSDMGNALPNLAVLAMSANQLEGPIPPSLANSSKLTDIYLQRNYLSGAIPPFGSLPKLSTLMLFTNMLAAGDWTFLSSLTNCTQLAYVDLSKNNLHGELPRSLVNLSRSMDTLSLGSNYITGIIPSEIDNLVNLTMLYLEGNLLTGNIPYTLGRLSKLSELSLSRNQFYGEIPSSLGNLNQLNLLYLQENNLAGTIPVELSRCKNLLDLNLSCNALNGSVPKELFGNLNQLSWHLDLSYNQLTDSVPFEIGRLINLISLNISHNKFSGQIPSTLGSCVFLQSLHMEGNRLEGNIPQSLMNLKGIIQVDLSQNNLSGEIPLFFEHFTSLEYLNLSFNNLNGPIPTKGVFANESQVFVQGNPWLCTDFPMLQHLPLCSASKSKRKHNFLVPLLTVVSVLIALSVLFFVINHSRKRREMENPLEVHSPCDDLKTLSYGDLRKATNGFSLSNLIGTGQFGAVYKGVLHPEDDPVAIKVFKLNQRGAIDSFISECEALRNIRHRNLVKVITVCSSCDPMGNEFKAIVLEHMANGSLESRLHDKFHRYADQSLAARLCIAVDVASALDYLHNNCVPPLVHCDLKPSNILFDDSDNAHVCDFGLARFLHDCYSFGEHNVPTSFVGPRGSVGYIAPEYGMGSKISTDGDIYSFGIVILELLTRKRPTDGLFKDGLTLHKYVAASYPHYNEVLDPDLVTHIRAEQHSHASEVQEPCAGARVQSCIANLLKLGLLCSSESPRERPNAHDVYTSLIEVREEFFTYSNWEGEPEDA